MKPKEKAIEWLRINEFGLSNLPLQNKIGKAIDIALEHELQRIPDCLCR